MKLTGEKDMNMAHVDCFFSDDTVPPEPESTKPPSPTERTKMRWLTLARDWFVKDLKLRVVFSAKRKAWGKCIYCSEGTQWVRRIDEPFPLPNNVVCENCVRLMNVDPEEVWMRWSSVDRQTGCRSYVVPDWYMMAPVDVSFIGELVKGDPMIPLDDTKEEFEKEMLLDDDGYHSLDEF